MIGTTRLSVESYFIVRWKYPQEWEDYMDFAVENDVGLTPDNPHIIYAESSKGNKHIKKFVIFLQYTIDFAQRA